MDTVAVACVLLQVG